MQGPVLGTTIDFYDATIEGENVRGRSVPEGTPGELVAMAPFPNVPFGLWGDVGNKRYFSTRLTVSSTVGPMATWCSNTPSPSISSFLDAPTVC